MSESITQGCDSIDTFNDSDISGDPSYNPEEEEEVVTYVITIL